MPATAQGCLAGALESMARVAWLEWQKLEKEAQERLVSRLEAKDLVKILESFAKIQALTSGQPLEQHLHFGPETPQEVLDAVQEYCRLHEKL